MSLLGLLCFLLAALDLATSLLGLPFTSVSWSPLVFMLLGGLFFTLESLQQQRPAAGMRCRRRSCSARGPADGLRGRRPAGAGLRRRAPPARAADVATGYRLGAQDRVQLTVFRQAELSGEFALDGEGFLACRWSARSTPAASPRGALEDQIEVRLKDGGYLVNPQVGVQLLTYRPFYVLGEVNNPGSYEYRDGMTVTNAIALAGGYSYRADQDGVTIERGGCRMRPGPTPWSSPATSSTCRSASSEPRQARAGGAAQRRRAFAL